MTLVYLAGAWLLGVAVAAVTGVLWWPAVAATGVAGLVAAALYRRPGLALLGLLACGLFVAGSARYLDHTLPDPGGIAPYNDGAPVRLRALVAEEPETRGQTQRVKLAVREVYDSGEWRDASGGVLLRKARFPRHAYGDVLELQGKLETPPALPDFDYRDYLARQGIVSVMAWPEETRAIETGAGTPALAAIYDARGRLGDALARSLPEPQAGLARGIVLGQRAEIPSDVRDAFNATGMSHLVAISGFHVGLVAALVMAMLAHVIGRRRAAVVALIAIAGYAVLTGASPSVVRAAIMGGLFVVATLAGRPASALTAIMLAAALMAGMHPRVIEDVSFQLSFSAIAGVVYLASPIESWAGDSLRRWGVDPNANWLTATLVEISAVTVAAVAATLPIMALTFERVSVVALVSNLLVVPVFPLIFGSSALTAVAGLVWQPLGETAAWLSWATLTYMIEVARLLNELPVAAVRIEGFDAEHAAVAYIALAVAGWWLARRHGGDKLLQGPERLEAPAAGLRPALALAGALAIAAGVAWWAVIDGGSGRLTVTVLDVGQGDAILIETPAGHNILVDGGPEGDTLMRELGEALPFWERTVHMIALTHPDLDHLAGLIDALERYDVRLVLTTSREPDTVLYDEWRSSIARQQVPMHEASPGDGIELGDGATLRVLAPDDALLLAPKPNDASLVLRLEWQDVSFLLTGDIESDAELALLRTEADVAATVLKVPHHGSSTSTTAPFVRAVDPIVAVVSVGEDNRFDHPAPEVVQRLADTVLLRTDLHGTITLSTDGTHLWVEAEKVAGR